MTADDVKVGQIVTVLDWYCNRERGEWKDPDMFSHMFGGGGGGGFKPKRDWMGAVLRVEAVSLPYVALTRAFTKEFVTLDLRLCELAQVSPDFIAAAHAQHEATKKSEGRSLKFDPYSMYTRIIATDKTDDEGDDA